MDKENSKSGENKILVILFIAISIFYVIYATISQRAMYLDGSLDFLSLLNAFEQGRYVIVSDPTHPRLFCDFATQLPINIAFFAFFIKSKYILSLFFGFPYFLYPLLLLWGNYALSKRSKRFDIFVVSCLFYSLCVLLFQIFAIVELSTVSMVCLLLFHYLAADITYTKKDLTVIILLCLFIFAGHEFILFAGGAIFFASLLYASNATTEINKKIKFNIGASALAASLCMALYILFNSDTQNESLGFAKEMHDFLPHLFTMNTLLSLIAIVLLIVLYHKKEILSKYSVIAVSALFLVVFNHMLHNLGTFLQPMWEQHLRSIPCWSIPLIILAISILDFANKKAPDIFWQNALTIALICGIAQTGWQITHTYWWNKNIEYMQTELAKSKTKLYIPEDHEEISSFSNPELRRYIWYFSYAATSMIFSKDYEIKTLLCHYPNDNDPGNKKYREWLFVQDAKYFFIPTAKLLRKTHFWDVTKVTNELDKYNKEHKIKTIIDERKDN